MEQSLPQLILPIKLERSSERLTSLGGLVVLEELARALKLWEKVDAALEGPKSGRGYEPHEFVHPLVWMLHAGGFTLNGFTVNGRRLEDVRELRAEREVLERLGLEAIPDAGTVGDWLRRQGLAGAEALQPVSQERVWECLEEELTLDVDATEIQAEKREAQWTYHHVRGYLPMLGYVNGLCVGHEFREGNASPGAGGFWSLRSRAKRRCLGGSESIFAATARRIRPRSSTITASRGGASRSRPIWIKRW
jgi:hypothetical protein